MQAKCTHAVPPSAPPIAHNPSYVGIRDDIADLVPLTAQCILDIGCSTGALGRHLKTRQRCEIHGIDFDATMLQEAAQHLDAVYYADLNVSASVFDSLPPSFDTVIAADILEHLIDPWAIIDSCHGLLSPGGKLIISIPNICHFSTMIALLSQKWPYRDRGIHDRSHLRFFSRRNIDALLNRDRFVVVDIRRNLRIIERPNRMNNFAFVTDIPLIRDYFTFQYLVTAVAK